MTNLPREICLRIKEARQAKGLNQSALAQLAGCRQSAISMFEAGNATKLSGETVKKISEILGVSLEMADTGVVGNPSSCVDVRPVVNGYCPNGDCPSNVPYVVDGRLLYRPMRKVASPGGGRRCTQCGEVLEMKCPSCGAPLNDGACCASCGLPYVTPVLPDGTDVVAYARIRRNEIAQLRELS